VTARFRHDRSSCQLALTAVAVPWESLIARHVNSVLMENAIASRGR
jgi:hypothetical protein